MKKVLAFVLAAVMVLGLTACGENPVTTTEAPKPSTAAPAPGQSTEAPATTEAPKPKGTEINMWRIGTASMTGNSYVLGSNIAQMINEKLDGEEASAQATGGSADNCTLLEDKEIEIGFIQSATAKQAIEGIESFDHKIEIMRGIGVSQLNNFHCVVNINSGVDKIEDLQGKKVGVGPMGGGVEVNAVIMLGEFGVTDFTHIYGTMGEALEQVQTGEVDAVVYATSIGASNLSDCMSSGKCKILGMTKEKADEVCAKRSEFGPATIPANTYQNQPEDVITFAGTMLLLTREDIDEDEVYRFTKAYYENLDYLGELNKLFTQIKPEHAIVGMCVPLHPGAERYLREIGVVK